MNKYIYHDFTNEQLFDFLSFEHREVNMKEKEWHTKEVQFKIDILLNFATLIILDNKNYKLNLECLKEILLLENLLKIYKEGDYGFIDLLLSHDTYELKISKDAFLLLKGYVESIDGLVYNLIEKIDEKFLLSDEIYEKHGYVFICCFGLIRKIELMEDNFIVFNKLWKEPHVILNEFGYQKIIENCFNKEKISYIELIKISFSKKILDLNEIKKIFNKYEDYKIQSINQNKYI